MKRQVVYPVRAIRRKNLGEAILLSLFFNRGQRLVFTLPPTSPADIPSYRDWVAWAEANQLPIVFEAGKQETLATLLAASESVITTSVTEGFGLAFLEPWTAGKLLWGRRLDDICSDHEDNGVDLQSLYDRIDVPLDWFDGLDFQRRWHDTLMAAAARYGRTLSAEAVSRAFSRVTQGGFVDFGILNESCQRQVLSRMVSDASGKHELVGVNPWLANAGEATDTSTLVARNRRAIRQRYGIRRYRRQLLDIYHRVGTSPVRQHIDKRSLIEAFFDLDRFALLKWGPYAP
jgi:hypothetical protein